MQGRLQELQDDGIVVGDQHDVSRRRLRGGGGGGAPAGPRRASLATRQLEGQAFGGGEDVERAPSLPDAFAADVDQPVDGVVVAQRIMMREREPSNVRGEGVVHGGLGRRVAPVDLLGILLRRVLCVVDHEVGAVEEGDVARVLGVQGGLAG